MSARRLHLVGATAPAPLSATPHLRGYQVQYRSGETTHCPGCGGSHWFVGRFSAECATCATALPIARGQRG